jgi:hypothetical protein
MGLVEPGSLTILGEASFVIYLSDLFALAVVTKALQAMGLFPFWASPGRRCCLC